MLGYFFHRPLPPALEGLDDLALDLRWAWSETTDQLWAMLDPEAWDRTRNPHFILQQISQSRLEEAASDPDFKQELQRWVTQRARPSSEG